MGIADRHYVRDSGRSGSAAVRSVRMWSVNTWLIAICVAVFVIDGLLPVQPVRMNTVWEEFVTQPPDESTTVAGPIRVTLKTPSGQPRVGEEPLYVGTVAGPPVGYRRIQYMHPIEKAMHFSTQRGFFTVHFWRLVGFQFLHSHDTIMHLVFNMIALYFFGGLVERYLGSKRYLAFYLLCGICGALMYTLLNVGGYVASQLFGMQAIPGLLFNDFSTPLIGASAGVFGVLMAGAFLAPNATVLLFFIIPLRLRTLAYLIVGIALFTIFAGGQNAGGEAGHLGGAIAGFYFIRHPHHLHGFFDFLGWADPTSHHYRGGSGRPARARAIAQAQPGGGAPDRAEVDRILDKVHVRGLASLTDEEKRTLREASDRSR